MMQLSFDLDTDLDQNEHKPCGKTLGRNPLVRTCSVPTSACTATEPLRSPLPYTRSYRGDLARRHGCGFKQHPTRLHRNAQLMSRHRLHAIELKVKGPHLCDLPLDFAARLRTFLKETLGMAPLYIAVGQGCVHLVVLLLELGRGAGLVGPAAQRLRRRYGAASDVQPLPARLMAFMRHVLPDVGAAAPGHVTVRHNQRTYDLGGDNPQSDYYELQRLDEDQSAFGPATGKQAPATGPSGSGATVTAAPQPRNSTQALSTSTGWAVVSSGGTWGSSGPGQPARYLTAWPASQGQGALASGAVSTQMMSSPGGGGGADANQTLCNLAGPEGQVADLGVSCGSRGAPVGAVLTTDGGVPNFSSYIPEGSVAVLPEPQQLGVLGRSPFPAIIAVRVGKQAQQQPPHHKEESLQQQLLTPQQLQLQESAQFCLVPAVAADQQDRSEDASGHVVWSVGMPRPEVPKISPRTGQEREEAEVGAAMQHFMDCGNRLHINHTNMRESSSSPYPWVRTASADAMEHGNLPGTFAGSLLDIIPVDVMPMNAPPGAVEPAGFSFIEEFSTPSNSFRLPPLVAVDAPDKAGVYEARCSAGSDDMGMQTGGSCGRVGTGSLLSDVPAWCLGPSASVAGATASTTCDCGNSPAPELGLRQVTADRFGMLAPSISHGEADGHTSPVMLRSGGSRQVPAAPTTTVQRAPFQSPATSSTPPIVTVIKSNGSNANRPYRRGLSIHSTFGGDSTEAIARLLMPQVPLAVARLHSQSHGHSQEVELMSPAVVMWPTTPQPVSLQRAQTPATPIQSMLGSDFAAPTAVDQEIAGARQETFALHRSPLHCAMPPVPPLSPSSPPTVEVCILMRCPDAIARTVRRGRCTDAREQQRENVPWQRGSGAGGHTGRAQYSEDSSESEWEKVCCQEVSQLTAWTRRGVVPLRQLDDFTEGCTRATLFISLPQPLQQQSPQGPSSEQRLHPLVSQPRRRGKPPQVWQPGSAGAASGNGECSRAIDATLPLPMEASLGFEGSPSSCSQDRFETGSVPRDSCPPPEALRGRALMAQLLFIAWRRGQALGPPCPILLLPIGLEDVAAELQVLQQLPGPQVHLTSFLAFLSDLGMWLEALHASTMLSSGTWSSSPSSGTPAYNGATLGGGGGRVRSRSNVSASVQSSHDWSIVTMSGAAASGPTSGACPIHGADPSSIIRCILAKSSANTSLLAVPQPVRTAAASASKPLTLRVLEGPMASVAAGSRQLVDPGASAAAAGWTDEPMHDPPLASFLAENVGPIQSAQHSLSSALPNPQEQPRNSVVNRLTSPTTRQSVPNMPAQQPQPAVTAARNMRLSSVSNAVSSSDITDERLVRFTEEVLRVGCDLLSYAIAHGAVATSRLILELMLIHGSCAPRFASPVTGNASRSGAFPAVAAAASTVNSVMGSSPSRTGSCLGAMIGPGRPGMLSGIVFGMDSAGATSHESQHVHAALMRGILEVCRSCSELGHTLLHLAVISRSLPMIRLLLETWPEQYGLPVSELNRLDKRGLSPAAYLQSVPTVATELENGDRAAEFVTVVESMLRVLGPPLPLGDIQEAGAAATPFPAPLQPTGLHGLQAVKELGNEASVLVSARFQPVMGTIPGGSDLATTVGSHGDASSLEQEYLVMGASRFRRNVSRGSASGGRRGGASIERAPRGGTAAAAAMDVEGRLSHDISSRIQPTAEPCFGDFRRSAAARRASLTSEGAIASEMSSVEEQLQVARQSVVQPQLERGGEDRPLLRFALYAALQMLVGSAQALLVMLFSIPRARDVPLIASLLALPGALLWLPSMCLVLSSFVSAAALLSPLPLPLRWRALLPPWLPVAITAVGRALSCTLSLAAAVELTSAPTVSSGRGDAESQGGFWTLIAGGRGMSGLEAIIRMMLMTVVPVVLEAAFVDPPFRCELLVLEYGIPLLYVVLRDSIPAAVVWLAYAASNMILGLAVAELTDLYIRIRAARWEAAVGATEEAQVETTAIGGVAAGAATATLQEAVIRQRRRGQLHRPSEAMTGNVLN